METKQMINGKQVSRREILRSMMRAGVALPFVAAGHPLLGHLSNSALDEAETALEAAHWTPRFLSLPQNELLVALSEAIVPGAGKAEVNRFIDLLLTVDTKENRKGFTQALLTMDVAAMKQFGKKFAALKATEQTSLLTGASTGKSEQPQDGAEPAATQGEVTLRDHFENLKGWVSGAYFSSEAGMKELGWTRDRVFGGFPGCEHSENHV